MIISFDGVTWRVLEPLVKNGVMVTLRKLMNQGSYGILKSVIPPVTAPAWSSFMTGKLPDKHGVYEFRCFDIEKKIDYITNASYIQSETIWQILSRHGKKIISINVPYTYPVSEVNGIMISGIDTPSESSNYCSPSTIKDIISKKFPDYVPSIKLWDMQYVSNENRALDYIEELKKNIDLRTDLSLYLLLEYEWDVLMIHFQETDYLQHVLWDKVIEVVNGMGGRSVHKAIRNFYKKMDSSIGRLWQIANEENTSLMIISDHGFTEHKGVIFPNVALEKSGLILRNKEDSLADTIKKTLRNSKNPLLKLFYTVQKKVRHSIKIKHPVTVHEDLKQKIILESIPVVWDKSYAVMVTGSQYAFIYVRDKNYIKACKSVLENMYDFESNEPLFDKILTLDEAYGRIEGNIRNMIIAVPQDGYSVSRVFKDSEFKKDCYFPGIHHPDGIFIAYGNNIKSNLTHNLSLIDIAPTCLYLLGLPIPSDMDGKVAQSIIKKGDKVQIEEAINGYSQKKQEYDKKNEEVVRERLRTLGYIE
jgi:predicted AlkP superfamily phosphohydrolase/phosphomutase